MSSVRACPVPAVIASGGRVARGGSGFSSVARRQNGETIRTAWLRCARGWRSRASPMRNWGRWRVCDRDFRPPEECRTALERTIRTAREAAARSAEEAVSIGQRGPTPAGPAPAGDAGNGETPGGRVRYAARLEPWESEAQKTKVLAILKEYGVEKADVFGSRTTFEVAKGREKPGKESDVDFAIWWRAGEHGFKKSYRLRRELEEACGRGIDLIEEPESHPNPLFVESWRMTRVPILRAEHDSRRFACRASGAAPGIAARTRVGRGRSG